MSTMDQTIGKHDDINKTNDDENIEISTLTNENCNLNSIN